MTANRTTLHLPYICARFAQGFLEKLKNSLAHLPLRSLNPIKKGFAQENAQGRKEGRKIYSSLAASKADRME